MSAIEAQGLAVARGDRRVVGPIDVSCDDGEVVLLDGASGCGKSTILKALGGLLASSMDARVTGHVRVAGADPETARPADLARRVGQLFQVAEEQLVALDVLGEIALRLENLNVPEHEGAPRVARAIREWGLDALAARESHTLSSGESKRVALAAATVADPCVLLLDEPLTALDPSWRARLARDVAHLRGRAAVLIAEHRRADALALADRVLEMPKSAAAPTAAPKQWSRAPPAGDVVVRCRSLVIERGGRALVREADVDVSAGLTVVVGLNGSGKTTLLRALAGLDAPAAGDVRLAGIDAPHEAPPRDVARRVGYASPTSLDHFTAATVAEEVALTPRALRIAADVDAALARVGLSHKADAHPLALSGGERQRLAFVVATAHAPRVLVLDEPTVGLDVRGRAALVEVARAQRECGGVTIAATHDEDLIALADRVLVVHDGRLTDAGAPEAFFDGDGRRLGYAAREAVA